MNTEKVKEIINKPGLLVIDMLHHCLIAIFSNLGYSSKIINNELIEVYFTEQHSVEAQIDNLVDVLEVVDCTDRYNVTTSWVHQFLIAVSKESDEINLDNFKGNLVLRVLPVNFLKENADNEFSFNELMDKFNAHKISDDLFLSLGIEDSNTVNVMPVAYKDNIPDWREIGIRNLSRIIGDDFVLNKIEDKEGEVVSFKLKSAGLFFSLPMSPTHFQMVADRLKTKKEDVVFSFISNQYEGYAINKNNVKSISMINELNAKNETGKATLFYFINESGILDKIKLLV